MVPSHPLPIKNDHVETGAGNAAVPSRVREYGCVAPCNHTSDREKNGSAHSKLESR
jgi:hypothetical protein